MNHYLINESIKNKKKLWIATVVIVILVVFSVIVGIMLIKRKKKQDSVVYKETTVAYGNLTVGITEDSSVSIGTKEQTFSLDISALVSDGSNSSASQNMNGNRGPQMGMMNFGWESNYNTQQQEMEIESVQVSVGEKVEIGDVLYTLKQEDVDEIRTRLEKDVEDTKASYEALQIEQKDSKIEATQGYDTYVTNGELADVQYQVEVAELEATLADAKNKLQDVTDEINENLENLVDYQYRLKKATESLQDAEAGVEDLYADRLKNAYYYITYENAREDAQELVDAYEEKVEELEEKNKELVYEMQTYSRLVSEAERNLEIGKLEAEQTKAIDTYDKSVAGEWYDVQLTSIDADLADAEYNYQSAMDKLAKFNADIIGNQLVAAYDGVITSVPLEAGDSITMNSSLLTLYDQDEVTMEVSLTEADKETALAGTGVVVDFTAYEDVLYQAKISDVGDATYDSSSGKVYYTVTVTILGDVTGLYEGMTGDITFITDEVKEVTYVSNRAIYTDETRTYVKVKDENGKIAEKEVSTGFTDGSNTEIIEGLSEGDIVLIESKVSGV